MCENCLKIYLKIQDLWNVITDLIISIKLWIDLVSTRHLKFNVKIL